MKWSTRCNVKVLQRFYWRRLEWILVYNFLPWLRDLFFINWDNFCHFPFVRKTPFFYIFIKNQWLYTFTTKIGGILSSPVPMFRSILLNLLFFYMQSRYCQHSNFEMVLLLENNSYWLGGWTCWKYLLKASATPGPWCKILLS